MTAYQTYRVRAGDTLTRIARLFHTSVERLVRLNRIRNADRIAAGRVLTVAEQSPPAPSVPLGALSRKYEVGNRGPGTVSAGRGDRGGVSYGSYQLAANLGRPGEFLAAEGKRWAGRFAGMTAGSAAFTRAWRDCAAGETEAFAAAQHAFIERTHYLPQCALIRREGWLDVTTRSRALQDAVWSAAVQHGPATRVVLAALGALRETPADSGFDAALIAAIYAERARRLADGRLAYFRGSSAAVQAGVARRFACECADALALLGTEAASA